MEHNLKRSGMIDSSSQSSFERLYSAEKWRNSTEVGSMRRKVSPRLSHSLSKHPLSIAQTIDSPKTSEHSMLPTKLPKAQALTFMQKQAIGMLVKRLTKYIVLRDAFISISEFASDPV